jgi:hypothetical protein
MAQNALGEQPIGQMEATMLLPAGQKGSHFPKGFWGHVGTPFPWHRIEEGKSVNECS